MFSTTTEASEFIASNHLTSQRTESYRKEYEQGAIKALSVDRFLRDEWAQEVYEFLAKEATFERIHGLYDPDERVDRETWEQADDSNRMYTFLRREGVREDVSSFRPIKYRQLKDFITSETFVDYLAEITGAALTDLQSFSASAYGHGDFLRPHTDQSGDRELAYIIYLNPTWRPEMGGALHLVGPDGDRIKYGCRHNRLMVFDVHDHEYHYIEQINEIAGDRYRYTLGGWVNGV
jgi:Rps23 Pro-64 3,4-dihydroxylase Tpa1-like proline 4-hydroxylase